MTPISKADMAEATRLTWKGRLQEAMAVLRGESPATGTGSAASREGQVFDGIPDVLKALAMDVGELERPMPAGARFDTRAFPFNGESRAYKLYVPAAGTGAARPLLVMLHGCTQSPDDFARGTRMNAIAEENGFIVAYPEQTTTANAARCWNWFNPQDQRRGSGEPALVAGIVQQIIDDLSVDRRRVFVAGLSAGAAAAVVLGANYSDLFAGIGVHSGLACGAAKDVGTALSAMRDGARGSGAISLPVPTIVFHGDRDRTVTPANGDAVVAQVAGRRVLRAVRSDGVSKGGIAFTRTAWAEVDGRPALEHWSLHGAGHAWSGGSASGSCTEPRGPDASREMLRFFRSLSGR